MDNNQALQPAHETEMIFIELRIVMDPAMHGQTAVVFHVAGPSIESLLLALTTLTGDIDETAVALSSAVLRQNSLIGDLSVDGAIDKHIHTEYQPPLVGTYPVEISSPQGLEVVRITVTTSSLGSMIGALFIYFSGAISQVKNTLSSGLDQKHPGVQITTNIPARTERALPMQDAFHGPTSPGNYPA